MRVGPVFTRPLPLAENAVTMAPPNEDIDGPYPRPIHARCPLEEGPPESLDRRGIEARWSDDLRIPQGLVHCVLKAAPDPAIERQNESALGPVEQGRVESAQADAPQHRL